MASDKPPIVFDDDNPEGTEADFARAKPAAEMLPPEVLAAFGKRRGRLAGSDKTLVSLRIDNDGLERFRAMGVVWQTRINRRCATRLHDFSICSTGSTGLPAELSRNVSYPLYVW